MLGIFSHTYAWVCAIPPRVVFAAKLGFALLAIGIVGTMVDWARVVTDLNGLFLPVLGGIALMVPALMATALRWKLLIGIETPRRFSFLNALRGWRLGVYFNLVMPGQVGGDVARAHYASVRAQIEYSRSFLVVLTERLFGLLGLCVLASIGLVLSDRLERFTPVPAAQLASGLALFVAVVFVGVGVIRRYSHIPFFLFPLLVLLSIAGQSSDILLVHYYGQAVSADIPFATLLLVLPLVFLASVIPLTPGGTGVREVTLTALLTLGGVPASAAALVALMLLVTKIGFGILCGVSLIDGTHHLRKATQIVARRVRPSG